MKPSCKTLNIGIILFLTCGSRVHADDVYMSNTGAGTITQIDSSGSASIFASGLDSPEGLAFDSAGNLYVADSGDGTIVKIDPAGNVSTFASGLNSPTALAVDPSGNLYVATPGNQTIWKIDSSGNVSVFATGATFDSDGACLASDNAGNIYANAYPPGGLNPGVEKFAPNGNASIVQGPNYYHVDGIAVDGAGNLYLATQNQDGIFGTGGLLTSPYDYPAPYNDPELAAFNEPPTGLAFDADGNLYAYFLNLASIGGGVTDAIVEFGVNGVNSVVATDIAGPSYIAVQTVPEPGIGTMVVMGLGVLLVGCRFRQNPSSSLARGA